MKNSLIQISLILILLFAVSCVENKEDQNADIIENKKEITDSEEVKLPPKFKNLLNEEMLQIQDAMQRMIPFLATGNTEAADLAEKIHNSFILKKSLSKEELQELISLLPKGFVKLDRAFHTKAKDLATAVRKNDFIIGGKIYGEMVSGCINCHSHYASQNFPGLTESGKKD
jgi:hypothetical protein